MDLSIIIPYVNECEWIQATIQSLTIELRDQLDFEIIAINNYTPEVANQGFKQDGGYDALQSLVEKTKVPFLKNLWYQDKLSHWNAKNLGVQNASADVLFFCDAHTMMSPGALVKLFHTYRKYRNSINGSLHLPISYLNDLPGNELIYQCVFNKDFGLLHYRFTHYKSFKQEAPFQVPCMSTCGMMISRDLYHELEGWPEQLGIYGGGENFFNFVQAVLGYTPHIMPGKPIYHYAAPRGYRWNHWDWIRNRMIAAYLSGGESWCIKFAEAIIHTGKNGSPRKLYDLANEVMSNENNQFRREKIRLRQKYTPEEWIDLQVEKRPDMMLDSGIWK